MESKLDFEECEFSVTMQSFQTLLNSCRRLVILTGAGISAESGIPTFRGAGGLWREYDVMQLASPQAFERDPSLVWEFYSYRRQVCSECVPNKGHYAISALQKKWEEEDEEKEEKRSIHIITQNIDRFHQGSGTTNVIELHGSLWCLKRVSERARFVEEEGVVWEDRKQPLVPALLNRGQSTKPSDDQEKEEEPISVHDLPHIEEEDGSRSLLRPAVVWFGEGLDERVLGETQKVLKDCDLFMVIGTSAVVYPAAQFVPTVSQKGVPCCLVNLEETSHASDCQFSFFGPSGEILPSLFQVEEMVDDMMRNEEQEEQESTK